jgi:nitrite reductase/ring-hydroxylating ferredoxin subunit
MGVGVDRNAFDSEPEEWTAAEGGLPSGTEPTCVLVDGVRVAVVNTETGPAALADRCSHRGGPLSEGEKRENCLVCPWHGSAFDIDSGVPTAGPASGKQPTYETRVTDNGLELRRRKTGTRRPAVRNP